VIPGPELEGKYEVLRKIREGGMGAVYEVRHRLLDERRVIKVIHPHLVASPELAERFRREARAASGLRHPNIAHLHDFSVDPDGRAYIIMELIDGLSLDEILRTSGPPPLGLGLEISRQALRAVGFLHRKGFLHRDVAPDNLMLTRDAEGAPLVKLIDLGIAKVLVESGRNLTMAGMFLGKPRYASPEQLGGEPIDGRSDLYSLAIVIYELLTGICPIQGDNPSSLLASHLFQPPLDFAVSDPAGKLPQDLRALLLKALAKKPEERFAGADEMRERLAEIQARFPWTPEDLDAVLVRPRDLDATAVLQRKSSGSTQERLDRQFQKVETPGGAVPIAAVTPPVVRTVPIPVPPPAAVGHPAAVHQPVPLPPPVDPHPPAPSPTRTHTRPGEGGQEGVTEEPRRRKALPLWIAAAAVLVLVVLAALFLRRDESVEVVTAIPDAAKVSSEADSSEAPVPEPAVLAEPPASTEPEPVSVQPAPPAPEPAQIRPEPAERTRPVPEPPVRKPERASAEPPAAKPERLAPAPAPTPSAPKPKTERSRRDSADEEEISFVDPPRALSVPAAPYPEAAVGSGAKGRVMVSILVNAKGEVAEAKVTSILIEEGGQMPAGLDVKALFRDAAVAAARRARFEPAMSDGVPVPYPGGELTYTFAR
jgi:serine/threonine-protein kinase